MTCLRVTGTGDLLVGCGSGQLVSLQWAQEAKKQVQKKIHNRLYQQQSPLNPFLPSWPLQTPGQVTFPTRVQEPTSPCLVEARRMEVR